ncbi:hypothetical protein [Serratia sp. Se-RSBMAAmG]|uniref:hypothetical protein n=1 Tax=Serratia sp. Se-RSBMAAmG TaxID=3043305 RepID=UPI0024AE949C|nr:hypothetical protein [Serratia sp. Se-RSBMAAmG]MDI6976125.1 hypothetical protein [Serratia sp. Se-RSBMAAmG]
MVDNVIEFPKRKQAKDSQYQRYVDAANYYRGIIKGCEVSNANSTEALFSGMCNGFGEPHPKFVREVFLCFYNDPTPTNWQCIRDILIDVNTTSWQLWSMYDKESPHALKTEADKNKYPDPVLFNEYHRKYKVERIDVYRGKLEDIEKELRKYR